MKKHFHLLFFLAAVLTLTGCGDSSSTGPDETIERASAERQFIWNAMNFWYFWQSNVPELADNGQFFENEQAFQNFLMSFSDERALFQSLLYTQEDDFSFFIDDFEVFMQSQQGISKSFGFRFGLVQISGTNDVFGYVQFVNPDSPADNAGLKRGDIFRGVNGVRLNINNFQSALSGDNYDLIMAVIQDGSIVETGETVQVQAVTLQTDPVFRASVLETGSAKVGYLKYNSFQRNSHERLNDVFAMFDAEGINELVVDLRYNGGGSVTTSNALATMISGLDNSSEFARFTFNSKRSDLNDPVFFLNQLPIFNDEGQQTGQIPINKLSINRVIFLTGFGTPSASETL
ncbi:MAG: S41 family peptidase, partial [Balneolaceae bacterium]